MDIGELIGQAFGQAGAPPLEQPGRGPGHDQVPGAAVVHGLGDCRCGVPTLANHEGGAGVVHR